MKKNIPKIAIIGKPNVGKSTLINRICSSTEAIVHSEPMITRDRKYYASEWDGYEFYLMDTGGIDLKSEEKLSHQIFRQTTKAIEESDGIIFLVDLKFPISPLDEEIAVILRKTNKKIILVGNKWDNQTGSYYTEDFLKLGFGYPIMISAIHGLNIGDVLDEIVVIIKEYREQFRDRIETETDDEGTPSICILGQPNVGKSTLFNNIINEDRVIVDEVEGTTRDSIDSVVNVSGKKYRFVDTAGLKKNKLKEEDLEFYSKLRTLRTIEKSDISLILIDSTGELTNQDLRIIELCIEKGTSVCILFNKMDLVDSEILEKLTYSFNDKLYFARFIPCLQISAKNKKGIDEIFDIINVLLEERNKRVTDNKLMQLFKGLEQEKAIYLKEKKFKIKFIRQIRVSPPGFLVFSNMDIKKKDHVKRFIESRIREEFGFTGSPIFFKFKF